MFRHVIREFWISVTKDMRVNVTNSAIASVTALEAAPTMPTTLSTP